MRINDTGTVRTVRYATEDGGVHVGDDHFDVIIPNGYGDGFHEYKVWLDASEWSAYEQTTLDAKGFPTWRFFTSFSGDDITASDGEELPAGRWAAYFRDGDVAFVAWELFDDGEE